ncbi:unnamed protein product [Paramecium octaurelia]|uniref:Uncharacterized protein n=1 Tax=Paramecium octaurelia TaxID=43137 RepID=A0A8S1VPE9_PAROT|nr:unnamed protein product [Paramecium octaurelia]
MDLRTYQHLLKYSQNTWLCLLVSSQQNFYVISSSVFYQIILYLYKIQLHCYFHYLQYFNYQKQNKHVFFFKQIDSTLIKTVKLQTVTLNSVILPNLTNYIYLQDNFQGNQAIIEEKNKISGIIITVGSEGFESEVGLQLLTLYKKCSNS